MDASKTPKTCYTDRIPQLSVMRTAACMAIIVLHTVFAASEYFRDSITASELLVSKIVENNMMWAVPLFLMVTGVLQLNSEKPLTLRKLYGKYIKRIFCALLVFSIIFRIFDIIMDHEAFTVMNVLKAFTEMITSKGWGHLWYLYLLIGLYVLLPFYRKIVEHCTDRELNYLICVYIVFVSLIPIIESFGLRIGFYISESLIYPLYLLLGHMIHSGKIKFDKKTGVILTAAAAVSIVIIDIIQYGFNIMLPSALVGYASPIVIIQSTGVFLIFERITTGESRIVDPVDKCSFGIYLVHMIFIRALFRYAGFDPYDNMPVITIPVIILVIFMLSLLTTALLKKIPYLKRII